MENVSECSRKIVAAELVRHKGYVTFDNGTSLEIDALSRYPKHYKCGKEVQFRSDGSCREFKWSSVAWDDLFADTEKLNFHGDLDDVVMKNVIQNSPNLKSVSFTHWRQTFPAEAVYSISAQNLVEFSMHVGVNQGYQVTDALHDLGCRGIIKLRSLMLVFEDHFLTCRFQHFQKVLTEVTAPGATVVLLFGGEDQCIKQLERKPNGYKLDGIIRMATNNLYEDETFVKTYDTFEVYRKFIGCKKWLVGSRIGWYPLKCQAFYSPSTESTELLAENALVWNGCNPYIITQKYLNNYDPIDKSEPESTCCKLTRIRPWGTMYKKWKIPGCSQIRIQKVIYHDKLTEFYTSNGFYMVLDNMKDEIHFFADMLTSERLTFVCTTSSRRYVTTKNMNHFLRNASQIEFVGTWYSMVIENIVKRFTIKLQSLTMTRIEFHTKRPLRFILNFIPKNVKTGLKRFHYDARATADLSVGSVVRGLRKSGISVDGKYGEEYVVPMKLNELLIICNKWKMPYYVPFRLFKHVKDMEEILNTEGTAITMVAQNLSCFTNFDRKKSNFFREKWDVMAPIAYPYRDHVNGLTRPMVQYKHRARNFNIYTIVPDYW
uniref:Uncharacterized protein n=1 Tax=Panagrolaimus sp. ES5 TaxID=591445 RepID=A0AC34FMF5_9BILA